MKTFLALLLLLSAYTGTIAQDVPPSKAAYYSWVYLNNEHVLKGVILETSDSSVQFIDKSFLTKGKVVASYKSQTIPVSTIERIKYRKRTSSGKGALLGAVGGIVSGAIVGYAQGDDACGPGSWCILTFSAEDKAGVGAILGIIPGIDIGLLLGSSRVTIHINDDQSIYNLARDELKKLSLTGR